MYAMAENDLVTIVEAARRYNVTPSAVYWWIKQGLITVYGSKIGRQKYVSISEIEAARAIRPLDDLRGDSDDDDTPQP